MVTMYDPQWTIEDWIPTELKLLIFALLGMSVLSVVCVLLLGCL